MLSAQVLEKSVRRRGTCSQDFDAVLDRIQIRSDQLRKDVDFVAGLGGELRAAVVTRTMLCCFKVFIVQVLQPGHRGSRS